MSKKVSRRLNVLLTIITVICLVTCLSLCIQVISGKNASLFGYRIYHILTGSMEPTIGTNSKVIVKEVDTETLEEGDIITFISRDSAIYGNANTHRIVQIGTDGDGKKCFYTRGDANNAVDSVPVYPEDIVGKVVFYMGSSVSLFLGFLHTKLGFVLVIVIPLMLLIWLFMRDFKNDVEEYIDAASNRKAIIELEMKIAEVEKKKQELLAKAGSNNGSKEGVPQDAAEKTGQEEPDKEASDKQENASDKSDKNQI